MGGGLFFCARAVHAGGMEGILFLGMVIAVAFAFIAFNRAGRAEEQARLLVEEVQSLRNSLRGEARPAATFDQDAPEPEPEPETVAEEALPELAPALSAFVDGDTREPDPVLPPQRARPEFDLETLLGARASVWIGGLALLLGAVFLLRYTIEAGLFTPPMRVAAAAVFGTVMLAASEWMARRDAEEADPDAEVVKPALLRAISGADIPALLAAVGMFSLFGAVYAAHALYGMINGVTATIGMGAVGVSAMALSLRRGVVLAAIGLVGALATPLLVSSDTPSFVGVWGYVLVITVAAALVSRLRDWPWVYLGALFGAGFWATMLFGKAATGAEFALWGAGVAVLLGLTARELLRGPTLFAGERLPNVPVAIGWLGIVMLAGLSIYGMGDAMPSVTRSVFDRNAAPGLQPGVAWAWATFALGIGAVLSLCALAALRPRMWPGLFVGAGLLLMWDTDQYFGLLGQLRSMSVVGLLAFVLSAVVVVSAARAGQGLEGRKRRALVAGLGAALGVWLALALMDVPTDNIRRELMGYLDPSGLRSRLDAASMLALFSLAGLCASLAAILSAKREDRNVGGAVLVAGALAWFVGTWEIDADWLRWLMLCVGLAASALVAWWRPSTVGRYAPVFVAVVLGFGAALIAAFDRGLIGDTPLFNALWLYFALPGGLCALAGWAFARQREDGVSDLPSQMLLGASVAFTALFAALLIEHTVNGSLDAGSTFASLSAQSLAAIAALLGGSWIRGGLTDWPEPGSPRSAYIVPGLLIGGALAGLAAYVLLILLGLNPLFQPDTEITGHPVANSLFSAYLLPSLLLAAAAARYSGRRPDLFVRGLGVLSGLAAVVWVTAQIRRLAQGPRFDIGTVPWDSAELYSVSAAWLALGIAVLVAGLKTGRRDLRLASGVLIVAATLKVFLVDMAELDGALRAASFIGLGLVLIGIGRFYQRVLRAAAG